MGGFDKSILCYTVMGNRRYGKVAGNGTLFLTEYNGMTAPNPSVEGNWIIYNNIATGLDTGAVQLQIAAFYANQYGGAFVQNIMENAHTSANALADFSSSDNVSTNTPVRNLIIWNNTMLGNRCFIGYNDAGTIYKERFYWSLMNNYFDRSATKGDTHPPANANRKGNWWNRFGCGHYGNHHEQNMISGNSFYFRWQGISSFQPTGGATGTAANAQFVNRRSTTEVSGSLVAGLGDGDYRIPYSSPLTNRTLISPIPIDLDGRRRLSKEAAGAYAVKRSALGRNLLFAG